MDKPAFGGRGLKKQVCVERRCLGLRGSEDLNEVGICGAQGISTESPPRGISAESAAPDEAEAPRRSGELDEPGGEPGKVRRRSGRSSHGASGAGCVDEKAHPAAAAKAKAAATKAAATAEGSAAAAAAAMAAAAAPKRSRTARPREQEVTVSGGSGERRGSSRVLAQRSMDAGGDGGAADVADAAAAGTADAAAAAAARGGSLRCGQQQASPGPSPDPNPNPHF